MKKYKIIYNYTVEGLVWIEAKSKKEAIANYFNDPEYGEQEQVVKSSIKKIVEV